MRFWQRVFGYWLAALFFLIRRTWRVDHAPVPVGVQGSCVVAILHAHHPAFIFTHRYQGLAVMLSRSKDGELILPSLLLNGIRPVRGSTRSGNVDKGGREALTELVTHARTGPVFITVDGPRGPRNHVYRGVVELSQQSGAPILPCAVLASRFWTIQSWDRLQIPKPFARITWRFGELMAVRAMDDVGQVRAHLGETLRNLESFGGESLFSYSDVNGQR